MRPWIHFALPLSLALMVGCGEDAPAPPAPTRDATPEVRPDAATDARSDDASPDGASPDGAPLDAAPDSSAGDAAPGCGAWTLSEVVATTLSHTEPVAPNALRSTRVWLHVSRDGCDELAMPRVELDEETRTARVAHRVWRRVGSPPCDAPTMVEHRPVVIRLGTPGRWTVVDDAPGGSATVSVEVGTPPVRPCRGGTPICDLDCDCRSTPGAVCLSTNGFGGPVASCIRPCEVDRDCLGFARCTDAADHFMRYCTEGRPECMDADDCPPGYRCDGGACSHDFRLSGLTRQPCSCTAECENGLSCVHSPGSAMGRCEARCFTRGAGWCPGIHACGEQEHDLSGLAADDAVCGFVGE